MVFLKPECQGHEQKENSEHKTVENSTEMSPPFFSRNPTDKSEKETVEFNDRYRSQNCFYEI